MRLLQEFKQFLLRGNVVDLAVAIVIGVAFAAVVSSFVAAFLTPLIAILAGRANVADLTFTLGGATFPYGQFLTALIAFVLVAAAVFFFVVKPVNALISHARRDRPADPTTKKCPLHARDPDRRHALPELHRRAAAGGLSGQSDLPRRPSETAARNCIVVKTIGTTAYQRRAPSSLVGRPPMLVTR